MNNDSVSSIMLTPLSTTMNLFEVLDFCNEVAYELVEVDSFTDEIALCGRLLYALGIVRKLCEQDLPPQLIENAAADALSLPLVPDIWSDSDILLDYALAMVNIQLSCVTDGDTRRSANGLLHDLVYLLAGNLKQPRFQGAGNV
ncbi:MULTISPECIES: hypothetical protein [Enterobacterales]|uniref:hypothetical protein n=1 Tax=Enterobacterales TaxID=91347 RepID=UPI002ED987A5